MNKCSQQNEKALLDYLCNQLDEEATEQMQFHLQQCDTCRDKLEQMRRMSEGLRSRPVVSRRFILRLAVAAVVMALFSIGTYYYRSSSVTEYPVEIKYPPAYNEQDSIPAYQPDSSHIVIPN